MFYLCISFMQECLMCGCLLDEWIFCPIIGTHQRCEGLLYEMLRQDRLSRTTREHERLLFCYSI